MAHKFTIKSLFIYNIMFKSSCSVIVTLGHSHESQKFYLPTGTLQTQPFSGTYFTHLRYGFYVFLHIIIVVLYNLEALFEL